MQATSTSADPPMFFWKETEKVGWLCQWYPCRFSDSDYPDAGIFNCAEQYMMYRKAVLFDDQDVAKQIMKASSPRKQKGFGTAVAGFNDVEWDEARSGIVERGSYLKFTQCTNVSSLNISSNEDPTPLKDYLLGTKDLELVEASPFDRIWGIGYKAEEAPNTPRSSWGLNLLGKALMKPRAQICEEAAKDEAAIEALEAVKIEG
ncbi:hypothetical protein B0A48_16729 [Cryoendolithus antarcticus]|uniref:NADAR domain-containing protein n=1 Tax=Cryoendolithus antarcticus TaxID=1507870 RepID=A0A1V8SDE9_9PEZI|nr:hypothetical protein B0A48_16729 [Cryoendolithus antarcticus]